MIPLATLYDEYNDRSKLTEQKNPFEYIVPPPQVGRNNKLKKRSKKTAHESSKLHCYFWKSNFNFKKSISNPPLQMQNQLHFG